MGQLWRSASPSRRGVPPGKRKVALTMSNDAQITVYFSCLHCLTVFRATQERKVEECAGEFYCGSCGSPVHCCAGFYDFSSWKPVTKIVPNRGRL